MSVKMSVKKSTTPRQPSATKSRDELRLQLARDLSAVLTNPETPKGLVNAIGDELTLWYDAHAADEQVGWRSVPYLADCLAALLRSEMEGKEDER